jgi:hypothetical protein
MARVNVDAATWRAFRMEAVRTGTSIAGYLGVLVIAEVERMELRRAAAGSVVDEDDCVSIVVDGFDERPGTAVIRRIVVKHAH